MGDGTWTGIASQNPYVWFIALSMILGIGIALYKHTVSCKNDRAKVYDKLDVISNAVSRMEGQHAATNAIAEAVKDAVRNRD